MLVGGIPMVAGGFVLDGLPALPAGFWSLRRGTASYKGKCINVRRSSDNTAIDIGFRGGVLDIASLLAFCGSGNGFVAKLYNQGTLGSVLDVLQATASNQAQIVVSGALVTQNGKPSMLSTSSTSMVSSGNCGISGAAPFSLNVVHNNTAYTTSYAEPISIGTSYLGWNIYTQMYFYTPGGRYGTKYVAGSTLINSTGVSDGTTATFYDQGHASTPTGAPGSNTNSKITLFYILPGYLSEATFDATGWSTQYRQALEHNQEAFYSITGGI